MTQDDVRKQRTALGAVKQRNGRLAYPVDLVRAELIARGVAAPPWFPRSAEQKRRRERKQTLAFRAGATPAALGLGWAVLFTGDSTTITTSAAGTQSVPAYDEGAGRYGGGLPPGGEGSSRGSGARTPRITSATPTAVCRDGTVSYSTTRRGTCSHHGGVAQWGPPAGGQTVTSPDDAAALAPSTPPRVPASSEYNGECTPVSQAVLDRLALLQPAGVDVQLVSGWSLQGDRGLVVGGYLSGTANGALIDGAFGSWYVRAADDSVHRYTDSALTLSAWPQLGNGAATPLSKRVQACAVANAG